MYECALETQEDETAMDGAVWIVRHLRKQIIR